MGLNVRDAGNPAGPPVLFVHGVLSSNLQWEPNLARLGAELRTILVELPGHGASPTPEDVSAWRPAALLGELERIRVELGVDRWWVVGQSFGGAVVIRYALAHPGRVHGVVFTNSRAVFGVGGTDPGRRSTPPTDLRKLPFHPIHASRIPADLQARMVDAADAVAPEVMGHVSATVGEWCSRDDLDRLTAPTLLVNGRWETAFQRWVPVARSSIADVSVVDLDGGHAINIEQPGGFDSAVLDLIRPRRGASPTASARCG